MLFGRVSFRLDGGWCIIIKNNGDFFFVKSRCHRGAHSVPMSLHLEEVLWVPQDLLGLMLNAIHIGRISKHICIV